MQFVFEWNRIDLPQRFRRKAKRKVRAQAWFRRRRSPWRAMEVSEKARLQKKAALVATKRSIGGTSERQFGEMRDSLIAWKILKEKVGDQKQMQRVLMPSDVSPSNLVSILGLWSRKWTEQNFKRKLQKVYNFSISSSEQKSRIEIGSRLRSSSCLKNARSEVSRVVYWTTLENDFETFCW